jgi:glycosyltransferase involved in cell wall biosynthesis
MKFVVAQLGARMHYAVPEILWKLDKLTKLYTDIASIGFVGNCATLMGRAPIAGIRRLKARVPKGIPDSLIGHFPGFGLRYRIRALSAHSEVAKTAVSLKAGSDFCRRVARQGFGDAGAVYAFSSMAKELLEAARDRGVHTVLEQINAPRNLFDRLCQEEDAAWPGWEASPYKTDVSNEFSAKEEAEWRLADKVICGSQFVADHLSTAVPMEAKCSVVPYGVDWQVGTSRRLDGQRKLRVLFCGRLSLIKGIPYLMKALDLLDSARFACRIAGSQVISDSARKDLGRVAEVVGIVPRSGMRAMYDWADVFVLPTLCEGSATVCYEALAAGLPVITTPHAGSVVRHGIDGFIVPIRDSDALASAMDRLATDPALYQQMSRNALDRASEFTLDCYAKRLTSALGLTPNLC